VVARPSLLNIRNLLFIVGLLLLVVVGAGVRAWTLERKVRRQTAALADIEQRRGRILEDINGSRPWLRSSRRLRSWSPSRWMALRAGARSPMERGWELSGEAHRLAHCPRRDSRSFRAAAGHALCRARPAHQAQANESKAVSMGAALATLAIETRKLYSDLLRRSEFDLLTDIHNRFSLEKRLDAQLKWPARMQASSG